MQRTIRFTKLVQLSALGAIFLQPPGMPAQAFAAPPTTPSPAPRVRMKWQDFIKGAAGAKRLASLQKAVAKMKSLNTSTNKVDYIRSWEYWANIHGQYASYFDGIKDQPLPQDGVAGKVWATCQHSATNAQANFWGWHRMY